MSFSKVKPFAGPLTEEDLRYIDYYIGENMGIFIPNGGVFEYALDPHVLPAYMFAFMHHERAYVCIDEKLIPLRPGGLLSVSPFVEHYEVPMDLQSRYVCINLLPAYFDKIYKEMTGEDIPEFRGQYQKLLSDLPDLVKKYIGEYEERALGFEKACKSIEDLIITKILRSIAGDQTKDLGLNVRFEIEKSIQYMYQHLHHKIRLEDLSKDVNMSISQFSKVFREEIGISPMEYLNDIRLERSRRILLSEEKNINIIAGECGFSSISYYTKKFKEKYKVSPSTFKKRYEEVSCTTYVAKS